MTKEFKSTPVREVMERTTKNTRNHLSGSFHSRLEAAVDVHVEDDHDLTRDPSLAAIGEIEIIGFLQVSVKELDQL